MHISDRLLEVSSKYPRIKKRNALIGLNRCANINQRDKAAVSGTANVSNECIVCAVFVTIKTEAPSAPWNL